MVDKAAVKFQGTSQYIATEGLKLAVNAACTLEKPLLVKVNQVQAKPCLQNKWLQVWA